MQGIVVFSSSIIDYSSIVECAIRKGWVVKVFNRKVDGNLESIDSQASKKMQIYFSNTPEIKFFNCTPFWTSHSSTPLETEFDDEVMAEIVRQQFEIKWACDVDFRYSDIPVVLDFFASFDSGQMWVGLNWPYTHGKLLPFTDITPEVIFKIFNLR